MIDIKLLRDDQGGDSKSVYESERKRFHDTSIVDKVIELDQEYRKAYYELNQVQNKINVINNQIKAKKKADKTDKCEEELKERKEVELSIPEIKNKTDEIEAQRDNMLSKIGNILTPDVPIFESEDDNKTVKEVMHNNVDDYIKKVCEEFECSVPIGFSEKLLETKTNQTPGYMEHWELMQALDGLELDRGRKVSGHRGYFMKGDLMRLNMALYTYGINFLDGRNFTPIQPPYFMRKDKMGVVAELADYDETLYKIEGKGSNPDEKENEDNTMYMIATAEQPLSAIYCNENLNATELPIRFAGFSSCFRKEAGAHGKDTRGIFRIHQFEKVEIFCITEPEKSVEEHKMMVETGQDFMSSLKLSFRTIAIVSKALNNAAAIKYDLEAWFPSYNTWRELQSCSNTTDYISRKASIRLGQKKGGEREKKFVHMLNGTLCATERTMCCILENYQTDKGIIVPEVLVPLFGKKFIPYKKDPVKVSQELRKKMKQEEKEQGK